MKLFKVNLDIALKLIRASSNTFNNNIARITNPIYTIKNNIAHILSIDCKLRKCLPAHVPQTTNIVPCLRHPLTRTAEYVHYITHQDYSTVLPDHFQGRNSARTVKHKMYANPVYGQVMVTVYHMEPNSLSPVYSF